MLCTKDGMNLFHSLILTMDGWWGGLLGLGAGVFMTHIKYHFYPCVWPLQIEFVAFFHANTATWALSHLNWVKTFLLAVIFVSFSRHSRCTKDRICFYFDFLQTFIELWIWKWDLEIPFRRVNLSLFSWREYTWKIKFAEIFSNQF